MKIRFVKREAKSQLKGQWGRAALLTLIFGVIYYLIPLMIEINLSGGLDEWMNMSSSDSKSVGPSISTVVITLALLPLSLGYMWTLLHVVRTGEKIQYGSLWQGFSEIRMYLKIIGTNILIGIYTFLWTLLLIIPGIIKGLAYSQTYFVLKDHPGIGINAAITESRKLMKGYKWKYFLFTLSFIGWAILGAITFGIGFLWIQPYFTTSAAAFYNELVKKQKGEEFVAPESDTFVKDESSTEE